MENEKLFVLQLAKTGTNKSLWDLQVMTMKDDIRGFVFKAKFQTVEYDKKGKDSYSDFYIDLDVLHVLADDIYNCNFQEWTGWEKQQDGSKTYKLLRSKNGTARELELKVFQKKDMKKNHQSGKFEPTGKSTSTMSITIKEGSAKYPDAKISTIDFTKPYKSRFTQATVQDMRVQFKKISTFIEALAVHNIGEISKPKPNQFRLWDVNELKKKQ